MANDDFFILPSQRWRKLKGWKLLPSWAQADVLTLNFQEYPQLFQILGSDLFTEKSWNTIFTNEIARSNEPRIKPLGEFLRRATKGPDIGTLMGAKARKKLVQSVVKKSLKLRESLELLDRAGVNTLRPSISSKVIKDLVQRTVANASLRGTLRNDRNTADWLDGVKAVLTDPHAYLQTISEHAVQWDEDLAQSGLVKHVNSTDASALYFLRIMTRGFCSRYKTPLRDPTIQLGTIFFPEYCQNLTSSSLQKVCPNPFKGSKAKR